MPDDADLCLDKAPDFELATLDRYAKARLDEILPESIATGMEKGAVICRDPCSGKLSTTPVRTGETKHTVAVPTYEPNCGCPERTIPVAYYHTHPSEAGSQTTVPGARVASDFSDDDKDIARDYGLIAYIAQRDGSMWRYNPPVRVFFLDGVRTLQDESDARREKVEDPKPVLLNLKVATKAKR
jgi:hypothetical protein